MPSMEFMEDITIGGGEAVPPNTKFIKTWRLKNNGKKIRNLIAGGGRGQLNLGWETFQCAGGFRTE